MFRIWFNMRQSGVCDLPRLRVIDVGAMFLSEAEDFRLRNEMTGCKITDLEMMTID